MVAVQEDEVKEDVVQEEVKPVIKTIGVVN